MSKSVNLSQTLLCALGVLVSSGLRAAPARPAAAAAAAPATPVPVVVPKSVFDDPGLKPNLHDPFFPQTKRAPYVTVVVKPSGPAVVTKPVDPYEGIFLKGITGLSRKLALVNSQSLATGETATVKKADGTPVEIQLIEIKDRSVIIKVPGGEPKEIYLRQF